MADIQRVVIEVDVKHANELKELVRELDRVSKTLPRANRPFKELNQNIKQTQIQARKGGRHLQNFSFQMQDIIVQTSGGTSVMRSLSQQLPQMLIGFGALGAVVGIVAAGLPILIQLFSDTEEEAVSLDDAISGLDESLSSMFKSTSTINMTKWIDEWNAATEAVRGTMLQVLEFDQEMASRAFGEALETLAGDSGTTAASNWMEKFRAGLVDAKELVEATANAIFRGVDVDVIVGDGTESDIAKRLGIDEQSLGLLREMFALFDAGEISIDQYNSTLRFLISENQKADASLIKLEKDSRALIVTRDKLTEANKKAAEAGGGGLLTGGTEPKAGKEDKLKNIKLVAANPEIVEQIKKNEKERVEAAKELQRVYNSLYPEAVKYQQSVVDLNLALENGIITQENYDKALKESTTAYEAAINGSSLATEATNIFLDTFDTAVNGVAQGTQSMSDAFENMTKAILLQVGKLAAIRAIGTGLSGQGGFLGDLGAALLAEKGAVVSGGHHVTAYAKGGVVSGPTLFPMANGAGLMGEAGAEAVMPLTRMSNGNLGVESSGMNVVINNNAPGVDVNPRQTESGLTIDVVMSAVSQAVRRGGNEVSDSFESSYALNRGRAVYGN